MTYAFTKRLYDGQRRYNQTDYTENTTLSAMNDTHYPGALIAVRFWEGGPAEALILTERHPIGLYALWSEPEC